MTGSEERKKEGQRRDSGNGSLFVIQEHRARTHHFDFRIERDGVLKSWAIPRGMPDIPGEKRLAVMTEDHPLDYAGFEGEIPEGEPGAGTVSLWDSGSARVLSWDEGKIEVLLSGARVRGKYFLLRFRRAGEKDWLLIRAKD